jgi:hypothetical protein
MHAPAAQRNALAKIWAGSFLKLALGSGLQPLYEIKDYFGEVPSIRVRFAFDSRSIRVRFAFDSRSIAARASSGGAGEREMTQSSVSRLLLAGGDVHDRRKAGYKTPREITRPPATLRHSVSPRPASPPGGGGGRTPMMAQRIALYFAFIGHASRLMFRLGLMGASVQVRK